MKEKRSYLFIYKDLGDYKEVRKFVNSNRHITTWRHELPNTFFIVSAKSANELVDMVQKRFKTEGTFLITEFSDNSQGILSSRSWHLLENKELQAKRVNA